MNFLDSFVVYAFSSFDDKVNARIIENERESPFFIVNEVNDGDIALDYVWFSYSHDDDCPVNDDFNRGKESCVFMFFIKWFIEMTELNSIMMNWRCDEVAKKKLSFRCKIFDEEKSWDICKSRLVNFSWSWHDTISIIIFFSNEIQKTSNSMLNIIIMSRIHWKK